MNAVKGPDNSAEERIDRMIKAYEKDLLRLCCAYLKDVSMAEDAVQETFLKAYRHLHAFRGESSEKTWLIRIAINVCRDMQRTNWFRNLPRMVNLDAVQVTQEIEVGSGLVAEIMKLQNRYREVIFMYYYEDLKVEEIAGVLNVSKSTVCRRIEKARRLLKNMLEGGKYREG